MAKGKKYQTPNAFRSALEKRIQQISLKERIDLQTLRIESILADRTFVKFHVDVGVGDIVIEPLEKLSCRDWLGFAGITTLKVSP